VVSNLTVSNAITDVSNFLVNSAVQNASTNVSYYTNASTATTNVSSVIWTTNVIVVTNMVWTLTNVSAFQMDLTNYLVTNLTGSEVITDVSNFLVNSVIQNASTNASCDTNASTATTNVITSGTLTIVFVSWGGTSQTVYVPGDYNGWNGSPPATIVPSSGNVTNVFSNCVTAGNIGLGDSSTQLEFGILNTAGNWGSKWSFSTWTLSGCSLTSPDGNVGIPCSDNNDVIVIFNPSNGSIIANVIQAQ
jgi:hypothetical protein